MDALCAPICSAGALSGGRKCFATSYALADQGHSGNAFLVDFDAPKPFATCVSDRLDLGLYYAAVRDNLVWVAATGGNLLRFSCDSAPRLELRVATGVCSTLTCCDFTNSSVAATAFDGSLLVLDKQLRAVYNRKPAAHELLCCKFISPDCLAFGGEEGVLRMLDLRSTTERFDTLCTDFGAGVTNLYLDSDRLFVGCYDDTLRVFDLRNLHSPVSAVSLGGAAWTIVDVAGPYKLVSACYGGVWLLNSDRGAKVRVARPSTDALIYVSFYDALRDKLVAIDFNSATAHDCGAIARYLEEI